MKCKVNIVEERASLSLTVTDFDAAKAEIVKERLGELKDILGEMLEFDEAVAQLSEVEFANLQSALAAMDLKYQTVLYAAKFHACSAKNVANGSESVSDHGFPEFDHG